VDPDASPLFARLNPDKWSVAIDVETAAGAALVLRLAAWADVVALYGVSGGREPHGLTPAALRAGRPELVVLTSAAGGATPAPLVAHGMALLVAAALLERARTGVGRHIDVSDDAVLLPGVAAAPARRANAAPAGVYPCARWSRRWDPRPGRRTRASPLRRVASRTGRRSTAPSRRVRRSTPRIR
jgi:crotonobetainyl-CoA:carnitine CoA-transferase CaiB-like acyl-CoA transferase